MCLYQTANFKVCENLAELKRDIEKSTITVENFKMPFSIIDKIIMQKNKQGHRKPQLRGSKWHCNLLNTKQQNRYSC